MTEKRRIFISYQREHEEDITTLVKVLEQDDTFEVWYDRKMETGEWWKQIITRIEWADVVILALSRGYLNSEACKREHQHAKATTRAILPVIVDPELPYEAIPDSIRRLQIEKYFGQADQYVKLRQNLNIIEIYPLPVPLPEPPSEPDAPPIPPQSTRWITAALGVLVLVVAGMAILLSGGLDPSSNGTPPNGPASSEVTPATGDNITTQATDENDDDDNPVARDTLPDVEPGVFDITLVYGEQDSLTIIVNAASNLSDVTLRTFDPVHEATLTGDFDALRFTGGVTDAGTCLIYEMDDTAQPRPLACSGGQNFVMPMQVADIFWFDTNSNLFADIAVYVEGTLAQLCPHANGSGRCDITNGQQG